MHSWQTRKKFSKELFSLILFTRTIAMMKFYQVVLSSNANDANNSSRSKNKLSNQIQMDIPSHMINAVHKCCKIDKKGRVSSE
ncbi:hypothetical protein T10_8085 [Trichinella papuae]|uniref:Uncharacterized protein n=1 Tax=Trichinella papuae TaxID=268474 RepID=A0A0V1N7Q1_9BILA|nr:hypothetical protein T10_8085 [Trichinella papuae]